MKEFQGRRKPFQGKKLHKDLRDFKNQEIKRSLVHRARLRKNYFKLLEQEGGDAQGNPTAVDANEGDENEDNSADSDAEVTQKHTARSSKSLPPQDALEKRMPPQEQSRKKPLNFAERAKLAKERKEQKREEQLQNVRERRKQIELSKKEREDKRLSLSKRTRKGQPVMGPKINDLLEKIRHNNS